MRDASHKYCSLAVAQEYVVYYIVIHSNVVQYSTA